MSETPALGRSCGGCTACCLTHGIAELQKPADTLCAHCTAGTGCGIYRSPTRPRVCREYRCSWLDGMGSDRERPDRTGLVIERIHSAQDPEESIVRFFEVFPGALRTVYAEEQIDRYLAQGDVVSCMPFRARGHYHLPPGAKVGPRVREHIGIT